MANKDYIDVDGVRFRKEIPSTEVKRNALFYAFTCSTLGGALKKKFDEDVFMLSTLEDDWGER